MSLLRVFAAKQSAAAILIFWLRLRKNVLTLLYVLVIKRLGPILVILVALAATDARWAVLQSVAWTSMLASNLQTSSLGEAVRETFDGRHPCCLCKAVADGKKSEKKHEFTAPIKRLEFVSPKAAVSFVPPQSFTLIPEMRASWATVTFEPPVPPPRAI